MPPMRTFTAVALALCAIAGVSCKRYDPLAGLSEPELIAVDHITRDPFVELWRTDRDEDGHLIVWTRQGDGRARYRVVAPVEAGQEAEITVLDHHPSLRSY